MHTIEGNEWNITRHPQVSGLTDRQMDRQTHKGETVYPFLLRSRSTKTDKSVFESREHFPESPIFTFKFFEIGLGC